MSNNHHQENSAGKLCVAPEAGSLLPGYIAELLNEAQTDVVENHLVACRECKERYLTVLQARTAAQKQHLNGHGVFMETELHKSDAER